MRRRLMGLAVAIALGVLPVAVTICDMRCVSAPAGSSLPDAGTAHAACHEPAPGSSRASITAVHHCTGHDQVLSTAVASGRADATALSTSQAVVDQPSPAGLRAVASRYALTSSTSSPTPSPPRSSLPLRI